MPYCILSFLQAYTCFIQFIYTSKSFKFSKPKSPKLIKFGFKIPSSICKSFHTIVTQTQFCVAFLLAPQNEGFFIRNGRVKVHGETKKIIICKRNEKKLGVQKWKKNNHFFMEGGGRGQRILIKTVVYTGRRNNHTEQLSKPSPYKPNAVHVNKASQLMEGGRYIWMHSNSCNDTLK